MTAIERLPHNYVSPSPERLAVLTSSAVDQIGASTAEAIEHTADELEAAAKTIADKLRLLAGAMREHTRLAHEDIARFSMMAGHIRDGVAGLEAKISGQVNGEGH